MPHPQPLYVLLKEANMPRKPVLIRMMALGKDATSQKGIGGFNA